MKITIIVAAICLISGAGAGVYFVKHEAAIQAEKQAQADRQKVVDAIGHYSQLEHPKF
jgi:hypothetical protein